MIIIYFGRIPLGSNAFTGPTDQTVERQNTFAEYGVTRGKPVLHNIGQELDTQTLSFFFSEEFCSPEAELARLEAAYNLKTPLPLNLGGGVYRKTRYVVDALSLGIKKTNRSGRVVRVEATITLKESPVMSLFGLLSAIASARAPALKSKAAKNPNVRR